MSGSGGTSSSGPATSGRGWRPAVPVPGNPIRIASSLPLLDASLWRRRVSRHPTVEVISRVALDAAAPLDLTAGAIWPAVMTAGVVVLAHCDLTSRSRYLRRERARAGRGESRPAECRPRNACRPGPGSTGRSARAVGAESFHPDDALSPCRVRGLQVNTEAGLPGPGPAGTPPCRAGSP